MARIENLRLLDGYQTVGYLLVNNIFAFLKETDDYKKPVTCRSAEGCLGKLPQRSTVSIISNSKYNNNTTSVRGFRCQAVQFSLLRFLGLTRGNCAKFAFFTGWNYT